MKAILALTSRYVSILGAKKGKAVDTNGPVQYYYETLHYLQITLKQYVAYAQSEELLATALIISMYEMLDTSNNDNWNRHLKGLFWIQRSQNVNGSSGGLRQAVWWSWLRQDLWAAFREQRKCYSFWQPTKAFEEMQPDELAGFSVYLLSQTVNYCAIATGTSQTQNEDRGHHLLALLSRWRSCLGVEFALLPTVKNSSVDLFQPLWVHPPAFASALQVHSFATILLTLHRPSSVGFGEYRKIQRTLSDAVATICGLAGMFTFFMVYT